MTSDINYPAPFQFPAQIYACRDRQAVVRWAQRSSAQCGMVSYQGNHTTFHQHLAAAVTAALASVSVYLMYLHDYEGPSPSAGWSGFPTAVMLQETPQMYTLNLS